MKIGAYSFIGSIISLLVLRTKSEEGICVVWNEVYYECSKKPATNDDSFVIPKNVSPNAKGIQLKKDGSKIPWLIDEVDYFQRYPELNEIAIAGPIAINNSLIDTPTKKVNLQENLFNLPKVRLISCIGCGFNSSFHMWKLPWDLERLVLVGNSYEEYSFNFSPYLIEINLENNSLIKVPHWHDKPAPLQELYLLNNLNIRIKFDDIAKYCDLTSLSMDSKDYIIKKEHSCDCYLIKKWINEFKILLHIDRTGLSSTNADALKCYKVVNCPKSRTEEFEKKKLFCYSQRTQWHGKPKLPFKPSQKLRRIAFIIVFVTFSIVAGGLLIYARNVPAKRKRPR